jgi:hypothetical protein
MLKMHTTWHILNLDHHIQDVENYPAGELLYANGSSTPLPISNNTDFLPALTSRTYNKPPVLCIRISLFKTERQ